MVAIQLLNGADTKYWGHLSITDILRYWPFTGANTHKVLRSQIVHTCTLCSWSLQWIYYHSISLQLLFSMTLCWCWFYLLSAVSITDIQGYQHFIGDFTKLVPIHTNIEVANGPSLYTLELKLTMNLLSSFFTPTHFYRSISLRSQGQLYSATDSITSGQCWYQSLSAVLNYFPLVLIHTNYWDCHT